jgi:predicted metal-dependent peptidase
MLEHIVLRPTAEVPGARIGLVAPHVVLEYNPAYLAALSPDERAAVLEHELRHILHRHEERRGERDPVRWNVACDMAINSHIAGLPTGAVQPPTHLWGKRAEDIYEALPAHLDVSTDCVCLASSHAAARQARQRMARRLLHGTRGRRHADTLAEALRRLAGDLPDVAEEGLLPQGTLSVPWLDILSRYNRPQGSRRTLQRPDRRGLSAWGKARQQRPQVVVVMDTSGSISAALGAAFVNELHRLRPHCLALTVLMADETVHAVLAFEELPGRSFRGRGNTDFNAALTYVNTHLRDHDLCVYLTDGQGKPPEVQPVMPLVWVVTENRQFPGRPVVFVSAKR